MPFHVACFVCMPGAFAMLQRAAMAFIHVCGAKLGWRAATLQPSMIWKLAP